ncbi:hypothetical protein [Bradyrhizobium sp. RDT46]|uniref:hypothetical protein n=1 Tax=Bradyrhizobium sp. RDT46 TaxID=3341829 RepID=UPI0035C672EF
MTDQASSHQVRRKLFESNGFRREASERLNLDRKMVQQAIEALVAAGVVPCLRPDNVEALAMDGAWLLMGIGSRVRPDAIARVTPRFASMTLQIDGANPRSVPKAGVSFEEELAGMFRKMWCEAAMPPVQGVGLHWIDGRGTVLFGTIDRWERGGPKHQKVFASEPLQLPQAPGGEWDFVHLLDSFRLPAVGGISISPLPLLGFIELLAERVEETAASVL